MILFGVRHRTRSRNDATRRMWPRIRSPSTEEMVTQAGFVAESEEIAIFSRSLDDWLAEFGAEPANGAVVREMIEASLETDAAGINARRQRRRTPLRPTLGLP